MNRLEFFGTEGAMRIDHRGELWVTANGERSWRSVAVDLGIAVPGIADSGFARGFMAFAPKIVESIASGATSIEHAATFADGLRVQRVLDAARESDAAGTRIAVSASA